MRELVQQRTWMEEYESAYSPQTVSCDCADGEIRLVIIDSAGDIVLADGRLPSIITDADAAPIDRINAYITETVGTSVAETHPIAGLQDADGQAGMGFCCFINDTVTAAVPRQMARHRLGAAGTALLDRCEELVERQELIPDEEVESGEDFVLGHRINKHIVQPLIGHRSSDTIRETVDGLIGEPATILDAACGDDEYVLELAERDTTDLCIANDISWRTTALLRDQTDADTIRFTNHNLLDLPIERRFDLVLFKNTLHHIPEQRQQDVLGQLADRAGDRFIVVDIEDPRRTSLRARAWNTYYRWVLGDQGGSFRTLPEFRELMAAAVDGFDLEFGRIPTVKGTYFYCSATRR